MPVAVTGEAICCVPLLPPVSVVTLALESTTIPGAMIFGLASISGPEIPPGNAVVLLVAVVVVAVAGVGAGACPERDWLGGCCELEEKAPLEVSPPPLVLALGLAAGLVAAVDLDLGEERDVTGAEDSELDLDPVAEPEVCEEDWDE